MFRYPIEPLVWLRPMTYQWPLVVLLALLTPSFAVAFSEYQGEVVRILDGDTLEVLHDR